LKHWRENLFYRILSLVLAVGLWLYVSGDQNPLTEAFFNVPLEITGLPSDLVVDQSPQTVQVRLQGRQALVERLTARDVEAVVDLQGTNPGENQIPVQVRLPENTTLVNVNPNTVTILLDQIKERQLPVEVSLNKNQVPAGFKILEPEVTPDEVLIAGPQRILDQIAVVEARVDLKNNRENLTIEVPVRALDRDGKSLNDWLKIQPSSASVLVPIVRDLPQKALAVKVPLLGEPAKGFAVTRVIIEPSVVAAYAPQELLDELEYLNVTPLDISGARDRVEAELKIELPEGVQAEKELIQVIAVIEPVA